MSTIFLESAVIVGSLLVVLGFILIARKALAPALAERRELADLQRIVTAAGAAAHLDPVARAQTRRWLQSMSKEERDRLRALCAARMTGGSDARSTTLSRSGA